MGGLLLFNVVIRNGQGTKCKGIHKIGIELGSPGPKPNVLPTESPLLHHEVSTELKQSLWSTCTHVASWKSM